MRSPFSRRGRILAVKWGLNPNSSSLGVDVTFLLFGIAFIALMTPILSLLLRLRWRRAGLVAAVQQDGAARDPPADAAAASSEGG